MVLADLFMYVFAYLFIYHGKFYLLYIQRKFVMDFVALKMLQEWFESSRVIWGVCVWWGFPIVLGHSLSWHLPEIV